MSKYKILQEAAKYQELFDKLVKGFKHLMKRDPNQEEILKIKQEAYQRAGKGEIIKADFNPNEKWWQKTQKIPENIEETTEKITIDDLLSGPVRSKGPKGDRIWDFSKKPKKDPPEFAFGGIAPLVGEPSYAAHFYDDRIPYEGGGRAGFPPITAQPQAGALPMQGPTIPAPSAQPAGITGSEMILKQQHLDQQKMQHMNPMMNQGIGGMQKYGGQFRKPFSKGGKGMSRRTFMKAMTGLAALPFVGKYFKAATPVVKAVENVASSNAVGMPAWFPKFIEKVLKQGDDVTDTYATQDRMIVKKMKLRKSQTDVLVEQDLVTGDTLVDIGLSKHGFEGGRHGQPARLVLKKGEEITDGKQAGKKTPDEFTVEEAEFTGGHPENVKFEEIAESKYGDHGSDFSEVEEFAIGKNVDKKIRGKKAESDAWAEGRAEAAAEEFDPDVEFASGGLARLLGE